MEILLQRFAINRSRQEVGNQQVATRISLFQNPTITFRLFFLTAFKAAIATLWGDFAASRPQSPCPLICSLISLCFVNWKHSFISLSLWIIRCISYICFWFFGLVSFVLSIFDLYEICGEKYICLFSSLWRCSFNCSIFWRCLSL